MRRTYKRSRRVNRRITKKRYSKNLSKRRKTIKPKSHLKPKSNVKQKRWVKHKIIGGTPEPEPDWEQLDIKIQAIKHGKTNNTIFTIHKNKHFRNDCFPPNCTQSIPLYKIERKRQVVKTNNKIYRNTISANKKRDG
jgi:hypothetical protein